MYGKIDGKVIREKLRECVRLKGPEVLRSSNPYFKGVIGDLLPGYDHEHERKLLIFVVNDLRLGDEFLKVSSNDEEIQQNFYDYQLQRMIESEVFAGKTVELILQSFAYSLGWQVKQPKPLEKPEPPKTKENVQQTSQQVIQSHIKSEEPKRSSLPSSNVVAYANKQVGDYFEFGCYPQGANGEVRPITWRVLRRDSDGLLVISEKGLDAKCYNNECVKVGFWESIFGNGGVTWSNCTLRTWLNGEFYKKAFNEQEQSLIKKTIIANNAGPSTEDNVFLLSIDEAKSLFNSDYNRICKPTDYAVKNNAHTWWWLRSRGNHLSGSAAGVCFDGDFYEYYVDIIYGSVRPALKLAI